MAIKINGNTSNNGLEVDATNNALVKTPGVNADGESVGGGTNNAPALIAENDSGSANATRYVSTLESDADYRLRASLETILDEEQFNYAAQNTGKHQYQTTTMTMAWTTGGLQTNSGNITTNTTGASFRSYAMFPIYGAGSSTYIQFVVSLNAALNANQVLDFGLFLQPTTNPFVPTDGVYFRADSAGWKAVINNNGTEVEQLLNGTSGTGNFLHFFNKTYKFLIEINQSQVVFWINDTVYHRISTPNGQGQSVLSEALPVGIRHAIAGGTAGAALQSTFKGYSVSIGGINFSENLAQRTGAMYGTYQGISGTTMGQIIAGTVTTGTLVKPTAAVPANTALTANLPNSLGGRIYEQLTTGLAANIDAIFASYTVPAGTVSVPGKRLKVTGIKLSGMVSTVVVGGPAYTEWYIVFGTTADSLATVEAAATKAPRRVMLPELTTNMVAAQAAGTLLVQPQYFAQFVNPIYVNPGERIQLVGNKTITTAITSGVLSFTYQFDYSWE